MLELSTEVDPSSIRDLERAFERMDKEMGKSAGSSVVWASHVLAKKGATLSKVGKKVRPIERRLKGKSSIFFVKQYKQGRPHPVEVVVGTGKKPKVGGNTKLAKVRKIKRAGLSKRVWSAINGKVGTIWGGHVVSLAAFRRYGKTANANAKVKKRITRHDAQINLTNRLTYSEDAYPGITNAVVREGAKTLQNRMDHNAERVAKYI